MKNQVNFGHLLALFVGILIPVIIWGVNVERRFEQVIDNATDVNNIKSRFDRKEASNQENFDKVMDKLHDIELQLKDKEDRE